MAANSSITQHDIRLAVGVIRRWLLTICHDLCIDPPEVEIRKPAFDPIYKINLAGQALDAVYRVRVYLQRGGTEIEYLKTLAHELNHLWQHVNNMPQTERTAVKYENDFIKRFYGKDPETAEYDGPILGLALIRRCASCGKRFPANSECPICTANARESARKIAEHEQARLVAEAAATKKRLAEERKQTEQNASRQKEIEWWRRNIDSHPDNGKAGYWSIQGQFYVRAKSAGEALIKVADHISTTRPKVKFVGGKLPNGLTPL